MDPTVTSIVTDCCFISAASVFCCSCAETLQRSDCLPSYLPDDGEAGVQVGQATRGQRGAASGELQEGLPLVT